MTDKLLIVTAQSSVDWQTQSAQSASNFESFTGTAVLQILRGILSYYMKISNIKTFFALPAVLCLIAAANGQTIKPANCKTVKNPEIQVQPPNRMAEGADNPDVDVVVRENSGVTVKLEPYKSDLPNSAEGVEIYLLDEQFDKIRGKSALLDKFVKGGKNPQKAFAVINSHLAQSALTDANGRANFQNVLDGTYSLLAVCHGSSKIAAWYLPVKIQKNIVEITLTRKNAFHQK